MRNKLKLLVSSMLAVGLVACWTNVGGNANNQKPLQLQNDNHSSIIIGGAKVSYFINESGNIYASGNGGYGQLGNGKSDNTNTAVPVTMPKLNGKEVKAVKIVSNGDATCFLGDNTNAYCWGSGGYGVTALGNSVNTNIPKRASFPKRYSGAVDRIVDIVMSHNVIYALNESGEVYASGEGRYGQLGNGINYTVYDGFKVEMPKNIKAIKVASNGDATCAIGDDTKVYCWGGGGYGVTALGTWDNVNVPKQSRFPKGAVDIVMGGYKTVYVLYLDGTIWSSGEGGDGQLGNGQWNKTNTPVEVQMPKNIKAIKVASNGNFTCAIGDNTEVYCWGYHSLVSVSIPQIYNFLPSGVIDIVMSHNVIYALNESGKVYASGEGGYGQLGNGSFDNANFAVEVQMPKNIKAIKVASNGDATCATGDDTKVYCWGGGGYGVTALGIWGNVNVPTDSTFSVLEPVGE